MNELIAIKNHARLTATEARKAIANRDEQDARITESVCRSGFFTAASIIACYVSFRDEVDTHLVIDAAIESGKQAVVPWCDGDHLSLCIIESRSELVESTFGLLEPTISLKNDNSRRAGPEQIDLMLIPGLAFTPKGVRLGYGKGFYDRLLVQTDALRVALAYDQQIVHSLPSGPLDIPMHHVVTAGATISTGVEQSMAE